MPLAWSSLCLGMRAQVSVEVACLYVCVWCVELRLERDSQVEKREIKRTACSLCDNNVNDVRFGELILVGFLFFLVCSRLHCF